MIPNKNQCFKQRLHKRSRCYIYIDKILKSIHKKNTPLTTVIGLNCKNSIICTRKYYYIIPLYKVITELLVIK